MALSACDKFLKKVPARGPLLALKAYAMVHLGKEQAGLEIAADVCKGTPTDLETLLQLEKVFILVSDCMPG